MIVAIITEIVIKRRRQPEAGTNDPLAVTSVMNYSRPSPSKLGSQASARNTISGVGRS